MPQSIRVNLVFRGALVLMINCLQFLGASAALASERARLRDRLIRMEYLAAETNLGPEDKEKFIRRRMNKAYCRLARKQN